VIRLLHYFRHRRKPAIRADRFTLRPDKRVQGRFAGLGKMPIFGFLAIGLLFLFGQPISIHAQSPETSQEIQSTETINPQYENNVKAAFLYSFGRYVEWPKNAIAAPSNAFIIGICGDDPIGPVLDRIAQTKNIQGRRITILKMPTIEELQPCQILFVSHAIPPEQQVAIIGKLKDKATLLVGETPAFCERGGGINFYLEGGTVRFEINVEAIRREKLMLDAKLLNLGRKISETAAPVAQ
jgi:hypothetical protein